MKLLIVLYDLANGGVERVLSVLANYFAAHGYEVYVVAISSDKVFYPLHENVHYKFVPLKSVYSKETVVKKIKSFFKLFRVIKRINPDCIIGFEDSLILRTVPIAKLLRKRIFISERTDPAVYGRLMFSVIKFVYSLADAVVFQTEEAKLCFQSSVQKKSTVIPNPLSENLPYRTGVVNKDIIMACRLRPQKNVALAIKAFSEFYKYHHDYRLVIYGEGEQLEELKSIANEYDVAQTVSFPGHISDIHSKMQNCAVYLSTSNFEGISNSMLEALAIGIPTICTDCPVGGARMFIHNGLNGLLVPVGDADAVAAALSRIVDNPVFADKLSAESVKIREELNADVICSRWRKLLTE